MSTMWIHIILLFCTELSFGLKDASLYDRSDTEILYNLHFAISTPEEWQTKILKEMVESQKEHELLELTFQGKPVKCFVPTVKTEEAENDNTDADNLDIIKLLSPLTKSCTFRWEGWWTYEFCYGKYVRQFHQGKNGELGDQYYLGYDEGDSKTQENPLYYSIFYENGTPCELTGQPRSSEIRIRCAPNDVTSTIRDIVEPSSCKYILWINTPYVCKHPLYKPKGVAPESVHCYTIDESGTKIEPQDAIDSLGNEIPTVVTTPGSIETKYFITNHKGEIEEVPAIKVEDLFRGNSDMKFGIDTTKDAAKEEDVNNQNSQQSLVAASELQSNPLKAVQELLKMAGDAVQDNSESRTETESEATKAELNNVANANNNNQYGDTFLKILNVIHQSNHQNRNQQPNSNEDGPQNAMQVDENKQSVLEEEKKTKERR